MFYGSDFARMLLGDNFHPAGLRLTQHFGDLIALDSESHVLGVASGRGTCALHLAEKFHCQITGIDLSKRNVTVPRELPRIASKAAFANCFAALGSTPGSWSFPSPVAISIPKNWDWTPRTIPSSASL
jgi:hypothetical protein